MKMLAKNWNKPLLPAPPVFVLKLTLGDMVDELLLASQNIVPERLQEIDFDYNFPDARSALDDLREKCRKRATPVSCPDNNK